MLSELFERLTEVGDREKPRLVFFFDEAHLLFDEAPEALVEKIEQVVRLIRSKGVGVYFITQNPLDIPDGVLAQLGNRVQHALRAFTPRDQKAVRTAAETLRANPAFETREAISELAVGEALVSLLDEKGVPAIVERSWILPPASRIGPVSEVERRAVLDASTLRGRYDDTVDRESAYERLTARTAEKTDRTVDADAPARTPTPLPPARQPSAAGTGSLGDLLFGQTGPRGGRREGILESAARSAARSMASGFGRQVVRGVLGSIFGGRR